MNFTPRRCSGLTTLLVPLAIAMSIAAPRVVVAQASNYPSLQIPTVSVRDYTGAIAAGSGTSLIFQWREGVDNAMHLGLDVGLTDRKGSENLLAFFGGSIASQLLKARNDQPLDLLLTGGIGFAFGGGATVVRVPIGTSVGHTFELEDGMALTPYVHPRVSLDMCGDCGRRGQRRSELSLNFDVGLDFRATRQLSVRVAGGFSGSDFFGGNDTFAIGLNWRPASVR
jgi:hypothetical protein